uniref:6,7-dimethyl-8-ribityllumazine synthase n=1 Tax=Hyaloperonospora arabidopsidis (strain Emoy2) TaxID=559515 RepID=M4B5S3_HYAAE
MGELKRPSTRVHAPPGGGSTWSFGGQSPSTASTDHRRVNPSLTQQAQPDIQMKSPRAAPAVTMETAPTPGDASEGGLRVALVKTSSDTELVDRVVQNCFEKLEGHSVSSETFTVASLEQLPYAANKLTEFGGFDAVICFGFLNTQDVQFPAVSAALTQSFIDISVKNARPVVRAVFVGEPRVASVKIKGGWGAEFADAVVSLAELVEFQ